MAARKSAGKMLRCARLDDSDEEIFEKAAAPGEWAIPGSFEFLDDDETRLTGKRRQAFNAGFLGLSSFGWCTIVSIAEASEDQIDEAAECLGRYLLEHFGAPDRTAALKAARSEIEYAASLCEYETGTLIAVERKLTADGIEERFKRFIPERGADWEEARPISLADLVKHQDL
ncbi:MAG TPA: DUF6505 family protein [Arenicellales bacterium]|nr:DUF6505 family protein [Arenicellales bacterium]